MLDPTEWGYLKKEDKMVPKWTTLPETWNSCEELIKCGCKKACKGRCSCGKRNLPCTGLCFCEGDCQEYED